MQISHEVDNTTEGTKLSHWTFNSVFGIVHAKNCSVCRSYIMHLADANHSGDASFKAALHNRESRISEAFLDGVQSGKQLQHEDYISTLARSREERDKALQSLEEQKKQLDAAREEIERLQRSAPAQTASDEPAKERNKETKSPSKSDAASLACSTLLTPTVDLDDVNSDVDILSPLSSTNQALPSISTVVRGIDLRQVASIKARKAPIEFVTSSLSSPVLETVNPLLGSHSYAEIASQPSKASSSTPPKLATTPPALPNSPTPTSASASASSSASHPTTIAQLQALMSAAHAGNDLALATIKSFCSVMHQVPVNERTELHHYVAKNWRKPAQSSSVPKQRPFNTEIFVDASAWGIGFVMDGVWIAWRFSKSPPVPGNGLDMGWAKMLAVEVGLRTVVDWVNVMIHKEGENLPLHITVRTDNWAIKRAIEKGQVNNPTRQEVLRRILDMLPASKIQLTVKCVDPGENLASNPARGVRSSATQMAFTPSMPSYLTDILDPAAANN